MFPQEKIFKENIYSKNTINKDNKDCDMTKEISSKEEFSRRNNELLEELNKKLEIVKELGARRSELEKENFRLKSENVRGRKTDLRWPISEQGVENQNIVNSGQAVQNFPFPLGMVQTPFQIMANWPIKFRNNEEDSPAQFLDYLFRFQRRYHIRQCDLLENLDAVFQDVALDWYRISKHNWNSIFDFKENFIQIYLDERFYEEVNSKIKFQNQKENEDIHSFLTGIRKLFTKLHPRKGLDWELRRAYENLRLEYKLYIKRNDFRTLEELENLGKIFESELGKSKIRGQVLSVTVDKNFKNSKEKGNSEGSEDTKKQYSKVRGTKNLKIIFIKMVVGKVRIPNLK